MNRKIALLSLWVLVALTFIPTASLQQPSYTPQDYISVLNVDRLININAYGQAVVNDTFTIANNGSISTGYFIVGNPVNYDPYLYFISASVNNTQLQVSSKFTVNSNISGYALILPQNLTPSSTVNVTVTMVYGGLIRSKSIGQYTVNLPRYPLIYYNMSELSAQISVPGTRTAPSSSTYTATNLSNYYYSQLTVEYLYSGTPLAEYNLFKRDLEVNSWLGLKVKETHNITILNTGTGSGITQFTIRTLPSSYGYRTYDNSGDLISTQASSDNITLLTVNFRYTVYSNQSYIFYAEYWLPLQAYTATPPNTVTITTSPPQYNCKNYVLTLIIPGASSFISYDAPQQYTVQATQNRVTIMKTNTTAYNSAPVNFSYNIGFIDLLGRPLLITAIIAVILSSFIVWKVNAKREVVTEPAEAKGETTKEEIQEFCRLYEDKTALTQRLEKLEADYLKRKVRNIEYRRQREIYLGNLAKTEKELKPLREHLMKTGGRYASIIRSLELTETEKEHAQRTLAELKFKYRQKKISTETYIKMKEDLERKIAKTSQNIDKTIIALKQETM